MYSSASISSTNPLLWLVAKRYFRQKWARLESNQRPRDYEWASNKSTMSTRSADTIYMGKTIRNTPYMVVVSILFCSQFLLLQFYCNWGWRHHLIHPVSGLVL